MKKILIYEAMPDIERAKVIVNLALKEIGDGNEVLIFVEEEVQLLSRNGLNTPHTISCKNIIKSIIAPTGIPFYVLPKLKKARVVFPKDPESIMKSIREHRNRATIPLLKAYNPDEVHVWNGLAHFQQDFIQTVRSANPNQSFVFMEAGWYPQKAHYYQDPNGVNGASSISETSPPPLSSDESQEVKKWKAEFRKKNGDHKIKNKEYIFIPLQLETDTNIALFSPFKTMRELLVWVISNTTKATQIVVRPHPLDDQIDYHQIANLSDRISIDTTSDLHKLLAECKLVIGVNSTVLLEALIYHKPVVALGRGVFSSSPAIYKHDINYRLDIEKLHFNEERADELISLLLARQAPLPSMQLSTIAPRTIRSSLSRELTTQYGKVDQKIAQTLIKLKQFILTK
ncbi:hypothetical protein ACNKU7_08430 [Microbulbifer sp. SA54]|uniref:capsular polysaccharide export protein, LipB/KpsS family n=1 Tax=Microbulbifer sp. SA54 TaxID=3401577 RepID=UPI003AAC44F3